MRQYLDLMENILENGEERSDRTGVGTIAVFGAMSRYSLKDGFPAMTTKRLAWKAVVSELLWMLSGSSDERRLAEILYGKPREELTDKTTIWTANANADYWKPKAQFEGDLGDVYGKKWRHWQYMKHVPTKEVWDDYYVSAEIDQVALLIDGLKNDPYSRRHIIQAFDPVAVHNGNGALPPCHVMYQFDVNNDNDLSCMLTIRSNDIALGNPFNTAATALLTHMVAQVCGFGVKDVVISIGNAHIYKNHIDGVREQLTREPYPLPKLWLNPEVKEIDKFTMDDIKLIDYQCHPTIKMEMAV
jgi:thymidylate synthase